MKSQIKPYTLFFLLIALCSIGIWTWLTAKGLGATFDSQNYWYAAQTFRNSEEYCSPTGYYTVWTPLFPTLLAILGIATTQFLALLLNLGGLYVVNRPFWFYFAHLPQNKWIGYSQILHLLVHPVFLLIHFFVWSEAWFMVLLVACCILLKQLATDATKHKKINEFTFWTLILLSNLLCMQRLAGVFFVGAFILWVCFWQSWKRGLLFACLALSSLSMWSIRNALIQGRPDFLDNIFAVSWLYSQTNYTHSLLGLFFPVQLLPTYLQLVGLWTLIGALGWVLFRSRQITMKLYSWLILCYLACMFFIRVNIPWSSDRYCSPVSFLLILIFWYYFQKLFAHSQSMYQRLFLGLLATAVIGYNLLRLYKNVEIWLQHHLV